MRLQGKNALITGAASGIGAATALAFAREGANVMCADAVVFLCSDEASFVTGVVFPVDGGYTAR